MSNLDASKLSELERKAALLALKRAWPLERVGSNLLLRLLELGKARALSAGESLCAQDALPAGFFLMVEGRLRLTRDGALMAELQPGSVFGLEAVLEGRALPAAAQALGPVRGLWFDAAEVLQLISQVGSLSRALSVFLAKRSGAPRAEVVRLEGGPPGAPLTALAQLLAARIATDFEDSVLVLRSGPPSEPVPVPGGAFQATGPASDARTKYGAFDYVFLVDDPDGAGLGVDTVVRLVNPSEAARLREQPARPGVLHVALSPLSPRPSERRLEGVECRTVYRGEAQLCRVSLDLEAVRRWTPPAPPKLTPEASDSLGRWARALTHRRVGVALSGGGAWGFYHAVLLERLTEAGVPIDVVSGASIGAVVGGYYAARGMDGVRLLVQSAASGELSRVSLFNLVTGAVAQRYIEWQIGRVDLEELPLRFIPITTDLATAASVELVRGPVSEAIRASASAPGMTAPYLVGRAHYVDGAISNDLPVTALITAGAGLTFANCAFPAETRRDQPLLPGRVGRFLRALNPLGRALDLFASGSVILHAFTVVEGQIADVEFIKSLERGSLARAFGFTDANEVIAQARADAAFNQRIDDFIQRWQALKRSRRTPGAPARREVA